MRRIGFFASLITIPFMLANSGAAEDYVVYDSHGKRDPFVPLIGMRKPTTGKGGIEGIASIGDVKFQGVAFNSKREKVAIMNGEIIKIGQTISRVTLKKIEGDAITFLIDDVEYALSLYEKEGGVLSEK